MVFKSKPLACVTCACERVALCVGGGLVSLRRPFQQVVEAGKAARQIAEQALLPRTVLGRQGPSADVGWGVGSCVPASVAQRLVGVGALGGGRKHTHTDTAASGHRDTQTDSVVQISMETILVLQYIYYVANIGKQIKAFEFPPT